MVAAGALARFRCRASRPAEMSWLHNAAPLPARGPALELRGVTRAHRGMYQCVARSGALEAQAAAELRLAGAPSPSPSPSARSRRPLNPLRRCRSLVVQTRLRSWCTRSSSRRCAAAPCRCAAPPPACPRRACTGCATTCLLTLKPRRTGGPFHCHAQATRCRTTLAGILLQQINTNIYFVVLTTVKRYN